MALLYRNNFNVFTLLSNCCPKIKSRFLKTGTRHFLRSVTNSSSGHYDNRNDSERSYTFSDYIYDKRSQAERSILVQVQTDYSYPDLRQYLADFGTINVAYHYQKKSSHYILIEFTQTEAVSRIMDSAMFLDRSVCVPVRSNLLWFRNENKTFNSAQKNNTTFPQLIRGTLNHTYLRKDIQRMFESKSSLSSQMLRFHSLMRLQDLDQRLRFLIAWQIESLFVNIFDGCRVFPFGSSVNGFGKHACDLDLVLNLDERTKDDTRTASRMMLQAKQMINFENSFTKNFLDTVGSVMRHFVPGASSVKKILNARVPIIKYVHDFTSFECDLSVANLTAIYMSELLWLYGEVDPRVRPLVYTIRYWAEVNNITRESPGPWITNFSLTLLVLFFLQRRKILPTLNTLHSNAEKSDMRFAGKVDCTFTRDPQRMPINCSTQHESLAQLLNSFFRFYLSFDFYTQAIDLRQGQPTQKRTNSALYIVNPLETALNVSNNVSVQEVDRLKYLCGIADRLFEGPLPNTQSILSQLFMIDMTKGKENGDKPINVTELLNDTDSSSSTKKNDVLEYVGAKGNSKNDAADSLNVAGLKYK